MIVFLILILLIIVIAILTILFGNRIKTYIKYKRATRLLNKKI